MPLVEVAQQRLNAGPERPPRLQPGRIGAGGLLAALRAGGGVLPRFDHHRSDDRQLDHLAPPRSAPPGGRQLSATAATHARAARDHDIRLAPPPAAPDVPTLRAQLAAVT